MTQDERIEETVVGHLTDSGERPEIFRFRDALAFVLRWEVEKGVSDDPDDRGGRTNDGITQREYDDWRRRHKKPPRDVALMDEDEREAIYWGSYWIKCGASDAQPPLDLCLFDTAVNMGVGMSIRFAQAAFGLAVDGAIGPQTRKALRSANLDAVVPFFLDRREARYGSIVSKDPSQAKWLTGWMNRLNDLRAVCDNVMERGGE